MQPTQGSIFYYETLPQNDDEAFAFLEAIIQHPKKWSENEWIDFKNGRDGKEREHWSKALSGFANSGGGVILWGIQTTPENKHDIPVNLALVVNPKKLEGQLKDWLASTVDPPVIGVQTRSLANAKNEGFVIAYIPPSEHKPHCAKHSNNWYYLRVGHQCEPASPALLRMLFYPNLSPQLKLIVTKPESEGNSLKVGLAIRNSGIVSAFHTLIHFACNKPLTLHPDSLFRTNFRKGEIVKEASFVAKDIVIHPDLNVLFAQAIIEADSQIKIKIYAKDMNPTNWKVTRVSTNPNLDIESFVES